MSSDIENRVLDIVKQVVNSSDEESITLDTKFESLGIDSLDTTELILELEEEFDINIPDNDVEQLKTVRDVVAKIKELS